MTDKNQTEKAVLKIVRQFEAPKSLVFDAFTTADALGEWWGPAEMPITVLHLDFKKGGRFHYKMTGNEQTMWGLLRYENIASPNKIEFISAFSDEKGNVCKSPFPIDFPLEVFNQFIFTEDSGITTLTIQAYPVNATAEQEATFYSILENMDQGTSAMLNQLERFLVKRQ